MQGYLDLIFHEHRFYFSVDTFEALFDGLVDVEIFASPLHHRSLTAANFPLEFRSKAKPSIDDVVDLFYQGQKQYVSRIEEIVFRCNKQDKQVVGVGCGPRSIKTIYDLLNMKKNLFDKVLEPEDSSKNWFEASVHCSENYWRKIKFFQMISGIYGFRFISMSLTNSKIF